MGVRGADHKNRVGWDNRRSNLRPATAYDNSANKSPSKNKIHSRFKGVTYDPIKQLYRARIMYYGKSVGLGRFKDETEAAKAYDAAAVHLFGEFAYVNY